MTDTEHHSARAIQRAHEEEMVRRIESGAEDPDTWDEVPVPPGPRPRLGSVISVRLDPDQFELLHAEAKRRNLGYTTLARELIVQGLQPAGTRMLLEVVMHDDGTFTAAPVEAA